MNINWSKYVDHIFTISFTKNYPERINKLNKELEYLDILNSGIYSIFYNIHSPLPFYQLMHEHMHHSASTDKYDEYVPKTFAHYKCIREAYELHYDHILVLEDDIIFLKNKELIQEYLDNIPEEYDLILLAFYGDQEPRSSINGYYQYMCNYVDNYLYPAFGASMYLMSYQGMEKWLNKFENEQFTCIDFWHFGFNIETDKLYKSYEQLSIQYNDKYSLNSSVNLDYYGTTRDIYEHYEILKWCANNPNIDKIHNYIITFFPSWKTWISDGTYDYDNFIYKEEVDEFFKKIKIILEIYGIFIC